MEHLNIFNEVLYETNRNEFKINDFTMFLEFGEYILISLAFIINISLYYGNLALSESKIDSFVSRFYF